MSSTILSTKKLSPSQKELLLNAHVSFVEYDAIKIEHLDFNLENGFDYYLFTSQNAVKSYLKKRALLPSPVGKGLGARAFCVGAKTKELLEKNNVKVIEVAPNANSLGKIIIEKYQKNSFLYFTGNLRREKLPESLTKNNVRYKEIETYRTRLTGKNFERKFDAIMFFSPSGVQSFIKKNDIKNSIAFCIGKTTASEAKKYTDNIIVANRPTIENVMVQAINIITHDQKRFILKGPKGRNC